MKPVPVATILVGIGSADRLQEEANDNKIRVKKDPCGESQFPCDSKCHDISKLCDGIPDCKDGRDETGCDNRQTSRYRRQDFGNYDFGNYDDFALFTTSDYADFNFLTTGAPNFGGFTTAATFGEFGPITTAMPDFSNLATTMADFGIATTALPLDFNVPTTAGFDVFDLNTAIPTTGLPDFGVITDQPTTADFLDFQVPTTQPVNFGPVATTEIDDGFLLQQTTQGFPDFNEVTTATEELPLFDVQTTAPDLELPPVTTELSLPPEVQTTAPSFNLLLETQPVTEPGLPPPVTTQAFALPTTAAFADMPTTNVPTFPLTGLPDPGLPTTAVPDFGFPTTAGFPPIEIATTQGAQSFICQNGVEILDIKRCDGIDDCGDMSDEQDCVQIAPFTTGLPLFPDQVTTQPSFPLETTAGLIFVTVAPTTAGFDQFVTTDSAGQLTTEPILVETTPFPSVVQTTQPVFRQESTVRPTQAAQFGGTTQGSFMDTTPPNLPSMSPMGDYNDENFARFQEIYQNWRGNVFNSWLSTMSLYKRRLNKFSGAETQSFCTRQPSTRSDCPNNDQECKSDLDGCLFCYCKINKEDDRSFIVDEYKRDIEFYQSVLQKQWEEMWESWERQYSEWEAENQL